MGEAREVMDRLTDAIVGGDWDGLAACYAADAVAVTPDQGEVKGVENIVDYVRTFKAAMPDLRWESVYSNEAGATAYDEGFVCGTHTEPLVLPNGDTIAATGKSVRVRECDAATIEGGKVTSHRFYYDQAEILSQLGLMPQ
jgi:ketosteroid isomerase-like protein